VGALLLSNKRAHLLFTAVSLYVMLCIIYKHNIKKILKQTVLAFFVSLAFLVIISFLRPEMLNILNRFAEGGLSGRETYWERAIGWFYENPILGIGWSQFQWRNAAFNWGNAMAAHNVYLQVLCETGIIGFAIYIFMVSSGLRLSIKKLIHAHQINSQQETLLFYSVVVQIFYLLYSLTGNCLYDNTLFFYVIAFGAGLQSEVREDTVGD
jgi:O-antigen ligase